MAMGIYNLRYGYFARGGYPSAREGVDNKINGKKLDEIELLIDFLSNYQTNIPELRESKKSFVNKNYITFHDNQEKSIEKLEEIIRDDSSNFGLIVTDIEKDLLNKNKKYNYIYRGVIYDLCANIYKKKIDLYSINDDIYPLDINILKLKKENLFNYIGENLFQCHKKMMRFMARVNRKPNDDVFRYALRVKVDN